MSGHKLSYLACPYSHPDPAVRHRRYDAVTRMTRLLLQEGRFAYSPLTHNVPLDSLGPRGDWETWKSFDHLMLERCDQLLVLQLPGWEESEGVKAELAYAQELGKPVEMLQPPEEIDLALQTPPAKASVEDLIAAMRAFFKARDWCQFHSPKNLALNVATEVGELCEHFRWVTEQQSWNLSEEQLNAVRDEIADVLNGVLLLADKLELEPIQTCLDKLGTLERRYPVEAVRGSLKGYEQQRRKARTDRTAQTEVVS